MSKSSRRADGKKGVDNVPYAVAVRRERSRELAQKRRTTYKGIMDELTQVLPFPKDVVSQLDYNSRLRLSLCFFRLKALMGSGKEEGPADEIMLPSGISEASGVDTQAQSSGGGSSSSEVSPGILQNMMTEALDGFILVISSDGNIVYLSESIHHHLGIFQSEHIGVSVYDIINADDHETVKKCVSDAVARAMSFTIRMNNQVEFICRMKCSRFKVATTITTNPGFKLVHVSGTIKMMNNTWYLVTMVRPVSPPSILEIRMEGNMFVSQYNMQMNCIFFDGRLEHLLGYKKTDLVGISAFNFHHHGDTAITIKSGMEVTTYGESLSGYYRFLTKNGFYVWLQSRATMMYDSRTGKPAYLVTLNYIISKEAGEKELALRQGTTTTTAATTTTASRSDTRRDSSHSYDPFPVSSREDGFIESPFEIDHDMHPRSPDILPVGRIKQEPKDTEHQGKDVFEAHSNSQFSGGHSNSHSVKFLQSIPHAGLAHSNSYSTLPPYSRKLTASTASSSSMDSSMENLIPDSSSDLAVSTPLAPWGSLSEYPHRRGNRRSMEEEESLLSPHEHQPVFSPECAPTPQPHGVGTVILSPHDHSSPSPSPSSFSPPVFTTKHAHMAMATPTQAYSPTSGRRQHPTLHSPSSVSSGTVFKPPPLSLGSGFRTECTPSTNLGSAPSSSLGTGFRPEHTPSLRLGSGFRPSPGTGFKPECAPSSSPGTGFRTEYSPLSNLGTGFRPTGSLHRHASFGSDCSTPTTPTLGGGGAYCGLVQDRPLPDASGLMGNISQLNQFPVDSGASILVGREWMADNPMMMKTQGLYSQGEGRCLQMREGAWQIPPSAMSPSTGGIPLSMPIPSGFDPLHNSPVGHEPAAAQSCPVQSLENHNSYSAVQKPLPSRVPRLSEVDLQLLDLGELGEDHVT